MEKFKLEYEKLYRALKKAQENESKLLQKCRDLNIEIVTNASKVETALQLSEDDSIAIETLKQVYSDFK